MSWKETGTLMFDMMLNRVGLTRTKHYDELLQRHIKVMMERHNACSETENECQCSVQDIRRMGGV